MNTGSGTNPSLRQHTEPGSALSDLWNAFRHPVHPETRANLERLWSGLASELQQPAQLYGRQWEGCGATLGVMPRCDFGCTACYLGPEANSIPPLGLDEVREQLRLIRAQVGRQGNVQLTDGEVVLRPVDEVVEVIQAARELELIPMLMTHGDAFRKDPQLLERLVLEGGLSEVCMHVDTTQRGRAGVGTREREDELHGVRAELAEIVRGVRARTGRELRVASTVTVTRANLAGVAGIVRWMLQNNDVFRILSFQPVADVGRTRGEQGVSRTQLWEQISAGLGESMDAPASAWHSNQVFGHSACTHVVMGAVWHARSEEPRFVPLRDPTNARAESELQAFFARFGGLSFRSDSRAQALLRALGLLVRAPGFWLGPGRRWALDWLRRLEGRPLPSIAGLASGRARLGALAMVSHHFMDSETLESSEGREREAACVFQVPYRGELVSMCRINAAGLRQAHYTEQAGELATRP